jgi:hypothetical protein
LSLAFPARYLAHTRSKVLAAGHDESAVRVTAPAQQKEGPRKQRGLLREAVQGDRV